MRGDLAPARYALAQGRVPALAEHTGTLKSPPIPESSGVAVSRRFPGAPWTPNDSGDGPMVYATNLAGEDLGRYLVPGATNRDRENMALAPCPRQQQDCLYLADTGDNGERRQTVTLYAVPEPSNRPTPAGNGESARSGDRVVLRPYTELYFFRGSDDRRLTSDGRLCWLGTLQPQGEGVAFVDDRTLVLTSEGVLGQGGPIYRVRC